MSEIGARCVFCENGLDPSDGMHAVEVERQSGVYVCGSSPKWIMDRESFEASMRCYYDRRIALHLEKWDRAVPKYGPLLDLRRRNFLLEASEEEIDRDAYLGMHEEFVLRGGHA